VRRPTFLVLGTLSLVGSLAVGWACSSDPSSGPGTTPPPPGEGGAVDARVPLSDSAPEPQPTCTAIDLPAATGPKFCELPGTDATDMTVPPEFCVREFTTTPIAEARVIRFAPNGDLFVAAPSMITPGGAVDGPGAIMVLPDDDHDGRADSVLTFAGPFPRNGVGSCAVLEVDPNNISCVHGLLFNGDYLYFTRGDEIRRFPYAKGARAAVSPASELVASLGGAGVPDMRWTHNLEQHPNGSVYVSRGRFESSVCSPVERKKGAVLAVHIEGKAALPLEPEMVADGFRNPMYMRCAPNSCGDCYASELTGDSWDSVKGREKIALLRKDETWGYPCCVAPDLPAPGAAGSDCSTVRREIAAVPLHDTPFGMDFDRGTFPEPYRHGLFMAIHGVVTSFGSTGVLWLATDPKSLRPTGEPKVFIRGAGRPNGRATDLVFAPDGRMFIADDTSGKIFWIAPRTLASPAK
jgi:glucose/arabinose dehydrogenase